MSATLKADTAPGCEEGETQKTPDCLSAACCHESQLVPAQASERIDMFNTTFSLILITIFGQKSNLAT